MSVWENLSTSENHSLAAAFGSLGFHRGDGDGYTVHFHGENCSTEEGVGNANLVLDLDSRTSRRLERTDSFEDLVGTLFSPVTASSLSSPWFSQKFLLMLGGVETLIHVRLVGKSGDLIEQHSLIFHSGAWIVVRGQLVGTTRRRVFHLTIDDALDYQRHLNEAARANSFKAFKAFAEWYQDWQNHVSEVRG